MDVQELHHQKSVLPLTSGCLDLTGLQSEPTRLEDYDPKSERLSQALLSILSQVEDADGALGRMVDYLRGYSGAAFAGLISCQVTQQAVTVTASLNHGEPEVQLISPIIYRQLATCLQAVTSNAPASLLRSQSQEADQRLNVLQDQFLSELVGLQVTQSVGACLVLPMHQPGQLEGWLVLAQAATCSWQSELDQQLKETLPILTIGLRQYHQQKQRDSLQTALDQRDQQLQYSLGQQQRLQAEAQKQVTQLRYINQLKDDFLNTTSHELRTPLTSMTLAIRMLRRAEITRERQLTYLDILEQQCNREIGLINDLLKLRQLEANELSTQVNWVSLNPILDGLSAYHQPYFQKASLALQLTHPEQLPPLQTDADSLRQILNELLINARKYAQPGSMVEVAVELDKPTMPSALTVVVSNWGAAILPEEIPHIFDKFHRGRDATQRAIQGTGLGLALVKALVMSINGTITVSSQPVDESGSWLTRFVLLMPLSQQGTLSLAEV